MSTKGCFQNLSSFDLLQHFVVLPFNCNVIYSNVAKPQKQNQEYFKESLVFAFVCCLHHLWSQCCL